jgi:hypothetical protein
MDDPQSPKITNKILAGILHEEFLFQLTRANFLAERNLPRLTNLALEKAERCFQLLNDLPEESK